MQGCVQIGVEVTGDWELERRRREWQILGGAGAIGVEIGPVLEAAGAEVNEGLGVPEVVDEGDGVRGGVRGIR